jgi:hypothetical protein
MPCRPGGLVPAMIRSHLRVLLKHFWLTLALPIRATVSIAASLFGLRERAAVLHQEDVLVDPVVHHIAVDQGRPPTLRLERDLGRGVGFQRSKGMNGRQLRLTRSHHPFLNRLHLCRAHLC